MTREEMWLLEEKYNGAYTTDFIKDCERLRAGEPLAYVIGHIPFLNTIIYLDSHPLIPRPETEFWTSHAIELMKERRDQKVLDLCAGSGCIGVSVLKEIPNAFVDFGEIEEKHHSTIRKNIELNGIQSNRTKIFGGNLFEHIPHQYDVILSNPPYIDPKLDRTEEAVKIFEPHIALYGGEDGLEHIRHILKAAPQNLLPNGVLILEHEPEHKEALESLSNEMGYRSHTKEDQYGVLRYTVFTRKAEESVAP